MGPRDVTSHAAHDHAPAGPGPLVEGVDLERHLGPDGHRARIRIDAGDDVVTAEGVVDDHHRRLDVAADEAAHPLRRQQEEATSAVQLKQLTCRVNALIASLLARS